MDGIEVLTLSDCHMEREKTTDGHQKRTGRKIPQRITSGMYIFSLIFFASIGHSMCKTKDTFYTYNFLSTFKK